MEESHRALPLNLRPSSLDWSLPSKPSYGRPLVISLIKQVEEDVRLPFLRAIPGTLSILEFTGPKPVLCQAESYMENNS